CTTKHPTPPCAGSNTPTRSIQLQVVPEGWLATDMMVEGFVPKHGVIVRYRGGAFEVVFRCAAVLVSGAAACHRRGVDNFWHVLPGQCILVGNHSGAASRTMPCRYQQHGQGPAMRNSTIRQWLRAGRKNGTASATIFVAALLILTGCSTTPTPPEATSTGTNSPTKTGTAASASATATPSSVVVYQPATANGPAQNVPVPVLPERAKEFSKEGLLAFAEHWYATLGYAFETGDPAPMTEVTGSGCLNCDAMKETVVAWHSEGRWIVGGQMYVLSQTATFVPVDDGTYQVISMVRQQNVKFFSGDKSLVEDRGAKPAVADILVANYSTDRWIAVTVEHLKGSKGTNE
ncbi:DUF6318 family protein, partial [Arthrobacter sp.]|uniref:DUF6318 family protein n=1 Tax=Arthrobacter sp. TaxID=1667 RepID=UPI0026E0B9C6